MSDSSEGIVQFGRAKTAESTFRIRVDEYGKTIGMVWMANECGMWFAAFGSDYNRNQFRQVFFSEDEAWSAIALFWQRNPELWHKPW